MENEKIMENNTCERCKRKGKILSNGLCSRCDDILYEYTKEKTYTDKINNIPNYSSLPKRKQYWC